MHETNNQASDDIKLAICTHLDHLESDGSFTTSGVCSEAPLPDLSFERIWYDPFTVGAARCGGYL